MQLIWPLSGAAPPPASLASHLFVTIPWLGNAAGVQTRGKRTERVQSASTGWKTSGQKGQQPPKPFRGRSPRPGRGDSYDNPRWKANDENEWDAEKVPSRRPFSRPPATDWRPQRDEDTDREDRRPYAGRGASQGRGPPFKTWDSGGGRHSSDGNRGRGRQMPGREWRSEAPPPYYNRDDSRERGGSDSNRYSNGRQPFGRSMDDRSYNNRTSGRRDFGANEGDSGDGRPSFNRGTYRNQDRPSNQWSGQDRNPYEARGRWEADKRWQKPGPRQFESSRGRPSSYMDRSRENQLRTTVELDGQAAPVYGGVDTAGSTLAKLRSEWKGGEALYGINPVLCALHAGRRQIHALYVQDGACHPQHAKASRAMGHGACCIIHPLTATETTSAAFCASQELYLFAELQ